MGKQSQQRTFHRCFLPSFGTFGQPVSEEKNLKSANQKQESPVVAMFVNGSGRNEQSLSNMAAQAIHVYDCMLYEKSCFSVEREIILI
jgi:uncharacterized alpha/beta hydrolase family protein